MIVVWRRVGQSFSFYRPSTDFVLGVRGGGKSSLLEHQAQNYLKRGQGVLDLYSSRDGENRAWLRSPWANIDDRTPDYEKRILLIHGDNTSVSASHDVKNISKVNLRDLEEYDLLISSSPLYSSPGDEFLQVNKLTDLLYKRLHWKRIVYLIVREASNLYYCYDDLSETLTENGWKRFKDVNLNEKVVTRSPEGLIEYQYPSEIQEFEYEGDMIQFDGKVNSRYDLCVTPDHDMLLRASSRARAQGILGFPRDLVWLYGYFKPSFVRKMKPNQFIMLTRKGSVGVGIFPEVKWHKQEKENIVKKVGGQVEIGDEIIYSRQQGEYRSIGDYDHARMVELYFWGTDGKGMGIRKVGDHPEINRSPSSVRKQLMDHDAAVRRSGFCAVCRRAGGKLFEAEVYKKTARGKGR